MRLFDRSRVPQGNAGPRISRRAFLGGMGAMAGAGTLGLTIAPKAYAGGAQKTLVYIFLRGGMDGLSLVVPVAGPDKTGYAAGVGAGYDALRSATRIGADNADASRRPLGIAGTQPVGGYGLHPMAGGFKTLYDIGKLAIVQAAGHPETAYTRSHFDAQEQCELGTPGSQALQVGWLTRYLLQSPHTVDDAIFTAMVSGTSPPASLGGWPDVATLDSPSGFHPNSGAYARTHLDALAQLYAGQGDLDTAASAAVGAVQQIDAIDLDAYQASPGITYPNTGLSNDLKLIAALMDQNLGIAVATADYGGWDTHNNQNVFFGGGSFGGRVQELCDAVSAFYLDLAGKGRANDVAIVVQSEFGRQIQENQNAGTDHGIANPMFVVGGLCNGGRIVQNAPVLASPVAGDAVRTQFDFRDVLGTVTERMLGTPASLVFPGHAPQMLEFA